MLPLIEIYVTETEIFLEKNKKNKEQQKYKETAATIANDGFS